MRFKGSVVEWNDDRGFGFIEPAGGGARVFCHISAFAVKTRRPMVGERVTYEVSKDKTGRMRAAQIRPADIKLKTETRMPPQRERSIAVRYVVVLLFFAAVIYLSVTNAVPWFVPYAYLGLSVMSVLAYMFDKSAAMNNRWRTQESTLHLFAIIGGWPGAWLSQHWFQHKSRKTSFQVAFWFCVVINVGGLWAYVFRDRWI